MFPTPTRTCDSCTECCQGTLTGEVYSHTFLPGKPCFFVGEKGCTIYSDRPTDPCKNFKCDWLAHDYLPMWMRPDLSKVIIVRSIEEGVEWINVHESRQKLDSYILSWIIIWASNNKKNIRFQISGSWNWIRNN